MMAYVYCIVARVTPEAWATTGSDLGDDVGGDGPDDMVASIVLAGDAIQGLHLVLQRQLTW